MGAPKEYSEGFLRSIAQEVDTPEGKKLVAYVPRYEVGTGKGDMRLSMLEDFINAQTLKGGRLISVIPQGAGFVVPIFLFQDEFVLPPEVDPASLPLPAPADEDDPERKAWEAEQ